MDRHAAGQALAQRLSKYVDQSEVLVLGLPRGGVPVAFEVAKALRAPLDVFLVRKLGAPGQPELAIGAIASGGIRVLNEDIVAALGLTEREIDPIAAREAMELARREELYRGPREPINARGKTVIVVDDGIATGASMSVAVQALRTGQPRRIVVAVPVAPEETCKRMTYEADAVVCASTPAPFESVGQWYQNFEQTSDEDVRRLLQLSVANS